MFVSRPARFTEVGFQQKAACGDERFAFLQPRQDRHHAADRFAQ